MMRRVRRDVADYLLTSKFKSIVPRLSESLLKTHRIPPSELYLCGPSATHAAEVLAPHLMGPEPVLEINPGPGVLSRCLLDRAVPKLKLFELDKHYQEPLAELKLNYPNRVEYTFEDFLKIWKLVHQDKQDPVNNRLGKLLDGVESKPWGEELSMKLIASLRTKTFITYCITSFIFQNSLMTYGRPEMYLFIPPYEYFKLLTEEYENKLNLYYKSMPVLFNTLFDHEILTKLPRKDFLPWEENKETIKIHKLNINAQKVDIDYLYLIKVSGKSKLPCSIDQLPLLWYFFKHHMRAKKNRIIPMLEHWIPGCGIWLITGQNPPGTNFELGPDENDALLPHITIFTQFSDLSTAQKITLYKRFISWPEFEHSPFKDAVENHIYKTVMTDELDRSDIIEQDEEPIEVAE